MLKGACQMYSDGPPLGPLASEGPSWQGRTIEDVMTVPSNASNGGRYWKSVHGLPFQTRLASSYLARQVPSTANALLRLGNSAISPESSPKALESTASHPGLSPDFCSGNKMIITASDARTCRVRHGQAHDVASCHATIPTIPVLTSRVKNLGP
ncbi:hypothetical protein BT63DRAFT_455710 [Microthyrium microscopicum]|uniref:Uncharacterized protein n=1 Tax=Microthyrium microscopicum TaxID=703497 RepID=A0A6A6UE33_9PEZI|nr:hypothetical protein BT63DRAFT_455710 [Microthyrium microscopicum]